MMNDDIPKDTYDLTFTKSQGPGGQNVNKLNTKAELRFKVNHHWLHNFTQNALRVKYKNDINTQGILVLTCQEHRTQQQNVLGVFAKLKALLAECSVTPQETSASTLKKIEKLARKANEKRIQAKKRKYVSLLVLSLSLTYIYIYIYISFVLC